MLQSHLGRLALAIVAIPLLVGAAAAPAAAAVPATNVFPIQGEGIESCANSFGAPRSGGRTHEGDDCFASTGTPLLAVESGTILEADNVDSHSCGSGSGDLGGITLWLQGESGTAYYYAHNSDNAVGTGSRVSRGQVIGYVGNTGNACSTDPHVHFQIHPNGRGTSPVNPYPHLHAWDSNQAPPAEPEPDGWSNIVEADLDGDGDDELGFYRNLDGRLGWYEMGAGGGLGSALSSRDYSPRWTEIVGADFDGDGDDEVAFYRRSDGQWQVYEMTANGNGLGQRLLSRSLSPTWNEITAGDFDGDGDDEVAYYRRSDGRWQVYEMTAAGDLGTGLIQRDLSPSWHEITAADFDGDGDDEVAYYRRGDGRWQAYEMTAAGDLGAQREFRDLAVYWTEIVSADLDRDGDDETGFYRRTDGRFAIYEMTSDGGLGTRINSLDLYP